MPDATPKPIVLIIDDERNTREGLQKALKHKYEILLAESADRGMQILKAHAVDVVLTDLRMPGMDGMAFTQEVASWPKAPLVIMLTAYGTVQIAVEAMKVGAYDYLTKPINLDNLEMVIDRGLESRQLQRENLGMRQQLDQLCGFSGIIGTSDAMTEVFNTVRQVAEARSTVLLTGESGTGKELIAHCIHHFSPRKGNPFVVVHCAALNPNLLESELFGHEKGAYTGAHERTIGRFEKADTGTLVLDEVGEIDASTQIKLLRVLENHSFERVGGNQPITVDVRVIAATNRNLKALVEQGLFREDLYYRLNVVNLHLPPLRERVEDIPLLLNHFLRQSADENDKPITDFTQEAVKVLMAYSWPGNVRELRNAVERMVVMARGSSLTLNDVPVEIRTAVAESLQETSSEEEVANPPATLNIDSQERSLIIKALKETNSNRTEAAKRLGISRRTLQRKLRTYALEDI